MLKVVGCFTQEHDFTLVAAAAFVCLLGSGLSVRLFVRTLFAREGRRLVHLILTGTIGGATIWATHFIAMLAYDPVVDHAYEPVMTIASLLVAMVGVTLAFAIAAAARGGLRIEFGGVVFGLTIATMHYTGMSAFQIPGVIIWDQALSTASVLLGAALGALTFNRIGRPVSRYCRAGATFSMVLAICIMHFTGMGAITLALDPTISVPPKAISDVFLSALVLIVVTMFLLTGFAAFLIEARVQDEAKKQFTHATLHDTLTNLPNRLYLVRKLEEYAEILPTSRVAVITLDLDGFKEINDLYGHAAGDALLACIASRLNGALAPDEFVARTGGDEFVAIKANYRHIREVDAFAQQLRTRVLEPVPIENTELNVGVSLGIASAPEHGDDLLEIQQKSDLAMHRAKSDPYCQIHHFTPGMDQQNRERLALVTDLRVALERDEFEVHYQLQNDIATRAPVGFEALLRWNHPTRGRVSPDQFIPIAEQTGLIRDIGLWVLRTTCFEAASWEAPYRMAVNVAPQQLLQPSFAEYVSDILIESRLAPERLELEITEASIIDDQENTLRVMHRIKAMGVRIAMDDFGTGYSSLATLQAFPFDKIKIDRSFISGIHTDPQRAAIVRSTLLLGTALGIPVLAEGVETEEELTFLQKESCAEAQGFYFGRPMALADLYEITHRKPPSLTLVREANSNG